MPRSTFGVPRTGCGALARRPLLRAAAWLYPVATAADVLATANHYLLDVITAPGVVLLAYAIAFLPRFARRRGLVRGGGPGRGGPLVGDGRSAVGEQDDPRGHDGERSHLGNHVPWPAREALVEPESAYADRYQRCGGSDHGKRRRDEPARLEGLLVEQEADRADDDEGYSGHCCSGSLNPCARENVTSLSRNALMP